MNNPKELKTLPFPYFSKWKDKNCKDTDFTVEWLRPHQICKNPLFYYKRGPSRNDVIQGVIGDCWVVGPISNLASNPEMLNKVVPRGQDFERGKYDGTFHFRFHSLTGWKDVYIDDILPTINKKLMFAHSKRHDVFWAPLLEKAYVKFVGCYENVHRGGVSSVANYHFTGLHTRSLSLQRTLWLKPDPFRVLQVLELSLESKCLLSCSPNRKNRAVGNIFFEHDHVYNVTGLKLRRSDPLKSSVRLKSLQGHITRLKKRPVMKSKNKEVCKVKRNNKATYLDCRKGDEFYISFKSFVELMDSVKICGNQGKGVSFYDKCLNYGLIAVQNVFIRTYP